MIFEKGYIIAYSIVDEVRGTFRSDNACLLIYTQQHSIERVCTENHFSNEPSYEAQLLHLFTNGSYVNNRSNVI